MQEEWKRVPDYPDYEVSNMGKIRSRSRYIVKQNGKRLMIKGKELKGGDNGVGYRKVKLRGDVSKYFYVHRLVAMLFVPNPDNKPCVNHIDNNPHNNRADNLEWCTKQENTDWMMKQGRAKRTAKWIANIQASLKYTFKPVKGTDIDTGEVLYFESLNAVESCGFRPASVCSCCKKPNRMVHLGYTWEYITTEEYENAIKDNSNLSTMIKAKPRHCHHIHPTKKIQNITTGEIFNSVKEAKEKYGLARMNITRAIRNGWKICGCEWKYVDDHENDKLTYIRELEKTHEQRTNKHND